MPQNPDVIVTPKVMIGHEINSQYTAHNGYVVRVYKRMQSFYKNMGYDTATGNKLASEAWDVTKNHCTEEFARVD